MPIVNFTPAFMATGLICPPDKNKIEYSVADEPGLFVECRATEKAVPTWYLRLKNAKGTNTYKKLGTIKNTSLTQARKLVKKIRAEHVSVLNSPEPAPVTIAPTEMTWNIFVEKYFEPLCKSYLRSAKRYVQLNRIYVAPRFGHMALNQITRKDVHMMHVEIVENLKMSPATSDHVVKYMRAVLNRACAYGFLEKHQLKNFKLYLVDNQISNYLNDEQMQKLLEVLRTDKTTRIAPIIQLLISTGARLNEILTATWENVNFEGRSLKVDAIRSKSKRWRSIVLNDSALWVIEQLPSRGKSAYLFPSPIYTKRNEDLPYTNITRAWHRLRKLAGVNIRAHDLRHGYASILVSAGRSLYEVQQILGHSDPKITMRYAHLSSKTLQEAANAASVIIPRYIPQGAKPPVAVSLETNVLRESANDISAVAQRVETQQVKVG